MRIPTGYGASAGSHMMTGEGYTINIVPIVLYGCKVLLNARSYIPGLCLKKTMCWVWLQPCVCMYIPDMYV